MAEGFVNYEFEGDVTADSAGVEPSEVNPYAINAMGEIGIDISHQRSKHVRELMDNEYDLIITLCDYAAGICDMWPKTGEIVHIPFEDPFNTTGTNEKILDEYRRVRDLIRTQIGEFLRSRIAQNDS